MDRRVGMDQRMQRQEEAVAAQQGRNTDAAINSLRRSDSFSGESLLKRHRQLASTPEQLLTDEQRLRKAWTTNAVYATYGQEGVSSVMREMRSAEARKAQKPQR